MPNDLPTQDKSEVNDATQLVVGDQNGLQAALSSTAHKAITIFKNSSVVQAFDERVNECNANKAIPIQSREWLELSEGNTNRQTRQIYVKWRPLTRFVNQGGFSGAIISTSNRYKVLGHWALEVGDYTHELTANKGRISRLRGRWVEESSAGKTDGQPLCVGDRQPCCMTNLTDEEIDKHACRILHQMKITSPSGDYEYSTFENNCQWFCKRLAEAISCEGILAQVQCATFFLTKSVLLEDIAKALVSGAIIVSVATPLLVLTKNCHWGIGCCKFLSGLGLTMPSAALQTLKPTGSRLYKERKYIKEHGAASYEIFDQKPLWLRGKDLVVIKITNAGEGQ